MEPTYRVVSFLPSIFFFAGGVGLHRWALLTLDGDRGDGLLNLVAGVVFVIADSPWATAPGQPTQDVVHQCWSCLRTEYTPVYSIHRRCRQSPSQSQTRRRHAGNSCG